MIFAAVVVPRSPQAMHAQTVDRLFISGFVFSWSEMVRMAGRSCYWALPILAMPMTRRRRRGC